MDSLAQVKKNKNGKAKKETEVVVMF